MRFKRIFSDSPTGPTGAPYSAPSSGGGDWAGKASQPFPAPPSAPQATRDHSRATMADTGRRTRHIARVERSPALSDRRNVSACTPLLNRIGAAKRMDSPRSDPAGGGHGGGVLRTTGAPVCSPLRRVAFPARSLQRRQDRQKGGGSLRQSAPTFRRLPCGSIRCGIFSSSLPRR